MSDHNEQWQQDTDPYWEQDARNDRDEWEQTLRAWEQDDRDRLEAHE